MTALDEDACPRCGVVFHISDWPFCPHGQPSGSIIGDEIPGGQVIENLGHEPMTFYSKKAIRDEADRRGLRMKDEWAGPHDRHLTNWGAAIDPQTLENARVLVSRGVRAQEGPAPVEPVETLKTWTREVKKWSEVE